MIQENKTTYSKKLVQLGIGVLVAIATIGLAACGKDGGQTTKQKTSTEETTTTETTTQTTVVDVNDGDSGWEEVELPEPYYESLVGTGVRQYVEGRYDQYNRPTSEHIQVGYEDQPQDDGGNPEETGEALFDYTTPDGDNYVFKYKDKDGKTKKAHLINRSHMVGYIFSGHKREEATLIPITRYLNVGTMAEDEEDPSNPEGMLYYETILANWLKDNPGYRLDYKVVANYSEDEKLPRSVTLFWAGFNPDKKQIKVELAEYGLATYDGVRGSVTLENKSPNAKINYNKGTAVGLHE